MIHPPLPSWVKELRPHQETAIEQIIDLFDSGVRVVFLDAPTGAGKTLIAEMVRREMEAHGVYICSGKSLQDQFARDFPYAEVLKGRANYPTMNYPYPQYTAGDCTIEPGRPTSCKWCDSKYQCPYQKAKVNALGAQLSVVNTSYFLSEANYVGNLGGRELVIADESDTLEQALMGFVEFNVGDRVLKELRLKAPKKGVHKETIGAWLMEELLPAVEGELNRLERVEDLEGARRKLRYKRLGGRAVEVAADLHNDYWVRDNDSGPLALKPVKVDTFGQETLWDHGGKWLLMSASTISAQEQADSLGLEGRQDEEGNWVEPPIEWGQVTVPMTFPVENRPVYLIPVARMVNKEIEAEQPKMVTGISKVLEENPGANTLIHTVSFKLTRYLHDELKRMGYDTQAYFSGADRDAALEQFIEQGGVLLAPSLDRGIDLPNDICRVQIIAKVPFPYLGDRQVSTRMHLPGGRTWYTVQTIRTIVQMTGRAVRHKDDWAKTYILDREFMRFYGQNERLFPAWWREAVEITSARRYM